MNNIKNFQGYTTSLKKSGLPKNDMIDYIAGIYNNNATRNDCLAFTMRYISPKNPVEIANESEFRRMLKRSDDKSVREMYAIAQERYKHVSRYRDDRVNQYDKTLTQIENEKLNKKDMKKESFEDQEINTTDFGMDNNTGNNIQQVHNDLASKMGDIETHLRDLVSNDQISLNQDQIDAISQMEKLSEWDFATDLIPILEKLQTIDDNATKLLVMKANMYLGKVLKESK